MFEKKRKIMFEIQETIHFIAKIALGAYYKHDTIGTTVEIQYDYGCGDRSD
jgi:hypothetical protein